MATTEIETNSKTETKSEESKAIEFNSRSIDRTIEAYNKDGVSEEIPHDIPVPKTFLEKFKSKERQRSITDYYQHYEQKTNLNF